jgi:hypothetical protein
MKVCASEKSSRTLHGVLRFGVETPCAVLVMQLAGVRTSGTSALRTQPPSPCMRSDGEGINIKRGGGVES